MGLDEWKRFIEILMMQMHFVRCFYADWIQLIESARGE